jgi:hypothetical protein
MAKVKVNYSRILKNSKTFDKFSEKNIMQTYNESKEEFFDEFESHPVTREIENGPKASNISRTLNGVGNLFSYIGFNSIDDPISELKSFLKKSFNIKKTNIDKGNRFVINYPNLEKIKQTTPMPWERGNSWVVGIEKGISGFSNYVYKRFVEGRSKEALQSENRLRSGGLKKTSYMTKIINNFVKNMEQK